MAEIESGDDVVRTSRDDDAIRERLQGWLATQLPEGANPSVSEISSPSASGMSSETLLFDVSWKGDGGATENASYVGRMAPSDEDLPTFPTYDMSMQAGVLPPPRGARCAGPRPCPGSLGSNSTRPCWARPSS